MPSLAWQCQNSPQARNYLLLASPASLEADTGLRSLFRHGPQGAWPPAATSPVLPPLYLLSQKLAVRQPMCRARQTGELVGKFLPFQDLMLQGPVGVQAADSMSPSQPLSLPH